MKKNKLTLYILSIILFFGCTTKTTKEAPETIQAEKKKHEIIQIDPRTFEDNELTLTDFTADIEYIPLSNKVKFGNVNSFKITNNAIYFVSGGTGANNGSHLIKFDRAGRKPIEIGKVGKGPGEYLWCAHFAIDEENQRVYIHGKVNTVLVFSLQGKYLRDFKYPDPRRGFRQMEFFDNKYLFIAQAGRGANAQYNWIITDTLGNIVSSKNNDCPNFKTKIGARSGIFKYNNKISYWVDYNDSIFTVAPNFTYEVSYLITPGDHIKPRKELTFNSPKKLMEKLNQYYTPHFFIETNRYLLSRYNFNKKFAYVFLDKETLATSISYFEWKKGFKGGIPNSFDGGLMFSPDTYFSDGENEYLGGIVQPYQLKAHVASKAFINSVAKFPEKKKALKKLANSLNENDNPVLMLVKLKE